MAYVAPTPATLKLRYPAFAAVDDATIEYWLTDARLIVTDSWIEADRAPAEMSLAAHNMARTKVVGLASDAVGAVAAKGVTSFRSASFSVDIDASAAKAAAGGGYGSTPYGVEFTVFLRRNRGGPFLAGC